MFFFEFILDAYLQVRTHLEGITDSDKNIVKELPDTIVASFYDRKKKFKSFAPFLNNRLWY